MMSSIGHTHHNRCSAEKCGKRRPYWSRFCRAHRTAALNDRIAKLGYSDAGEYLAAQLRQSPVGRS
jgi:hypothetical protein